MEVVIVRKENGGVFECHVAGVVQIRVYFDLGCLRLVLVTLIVCVPVSSFGFCVFFFSVLFCFVCWFDYA